MNLTLIRHGEVEEKYLGAYNGHIDISLSQHGRAQAKNLAKDFKAKDFDAIFCSDLKRARETVELFLNTDDVIYTQKLREKSWGKHEGLHYDEIGIEYTNFLDFINALDGENIEEFTDRVKNFCYEELPLLNKENILLITHSGFIKTLLSLHENISLENAFSKAVPYASITRITI